MPRRTLLVTCLASLSVAGVALAQNAGVQSIIGNVFLQDSSPGTPQIGHATLTGTFRAGQVFVQQDSPITIPVVGNNLAANGATIGGSFSSAGQNGIGVRATATSLTGTTIGIRGESRSSNGTGVYGLSSSTASIAATSGVFGEARGTGGIGVRGLSLKGAGVFGESEDATGMTAISRKSIGLFAISDDSIALRADARNSISAAVAGTNALAAGLSRGGSFTVSSPDGFAVFGTARSTGTGAGVYGKGLSPNGYGVASEGRFVAFGGVKNFAIDHPHDPQNTYLFHYCTEGKEPLNVYSGTVVTDAHGWATIRLPDYFEEITRDPRVHLTVDDTSEDFVMCKVVGGVAKGAFRVRTSKGSTKVYWRVEAVRDDVYARYYGVADAQPKPQALRGTYIMPMLYGRPESMSQSAAMDAGHEPRQEAIASPR